MKVNLIAGFLTLCLSIQGWAQGILADKSAFAVITAVIYVDPGETELVKTAAKLLQQDIERMTGKQIPIVMKIDQVRKNIIAISTLP